KVGQATNFFAQCAKDKSQVLIPTVVITEFLVGCDLAAFDAVEAKLSAGFQIGNYDIKAARKCAELFHRYALMNPSFKTEEKDKVKMKRDFMIVATAIAGGASAIFSEDAGIARFAQGLIPVSPLSPVEVQQTFTSVV